MLNGKAGVAHLSVKMDGAPAFVLGRNPETSRFFIGTKSVFSGKVAQSDMDIFSMYPDKHLAEKLLLLYHSYRHIPWNTILQGDLLWLPNTKVETDDFITFVPNTLRYHLMKSSPTGREAIGKDIGVVFHTEYIGDTFKDLQAVMYSGRQASDIQLHSRNTFQMATLFDTISITSDTTKVVEVLYGALQAKKNSADYVTALAPYTQGRLHNLMMKYINTSVRTGQEKTPRNFKVFIHTEYLREAQRLKTMRGKDRKITEARDLVDSLDDIPLQSIFTFHDLVMEIKNRIISVIDAGHELPFIVRLPDGTQCGHEGYVVRFVKDNRYVKLVRRDVFSKANMDFTAKAWKL